MLKIVPDPPHPHAFLEDTLVQISEHLHCALAVAHQSVLLCTKSPGSMLMLAAVHEMETAALAAGIGTGAGATGGDVTALALKPSPFASERAATSNAMTSRITA
jgi:hypothetical protein